MDINLKKKIVILDEDLLLGVHTEIVQPLDKNKIGDLLTKVNIPSRDVNFGKIRRIDLIPFVRNNVPTFQFDIRSYFDRGMPEEIQMDLTIWFQEEVEVEEGEGEGEGGSTFETFSFKKNILLKSTEFILDLQDIQDKVLKIDFRMGTKFYNVQDHFFKTWDIKELTNSFYLYDYWTNEVPIPAFQRQSPTSLPAHLRNKATKLQETINVYRVPGINKIPLIELAEKIYIYNVPWVDDMEPTALDSTLVPEFRAGITKYLNNTLKGTIGEEQIFIRYPVDNTETNFRYFVFINLAFHEITEDQEVVSSAYSVLSSLTKVPLLDFARTVFSKEQDIYSIDITSMHLCFIKYRNLTRADLGVRYSISQACYARPMHAGELTYCPPVLNLAGNTWYSEGDVDMVLGNMGNTYYFAEQIN